MADWEIAQEKAFLTWANNHLREGGFPEVGNLEDGFRDGVALHNLLTHLSKKPFKKKITAKPRHNAQQLDNLKNCFNNMDDMGLSLVNIGAADIHAGTKKLALGLLWNLILHFEIGKFTEGGDKSKAKADLRLWVQNRCEEGGVTVTNFTSDFKDGKALAALCESVKPTGLGNRDISDTTLENSLERAARVLQVPSLLDATVFAADEQTMMVYLAQFYQRYGTKQEVEENRKCEEDERRLDVSKSTLEGEGLDNPIRFKPNKFIVTPRDANGKIIPLKLRQIQATVTSMGGQGVPVTLVRGEGEYAGSFIGSFIPVEQGAHVLDVTLKGEHMVTCPRLINVVDDSSLPSSLLPPPLFSHATCLVKGMEEGGWEGEVKELVISPCDAAGNFLSGVSRERVQVVFTNARGGVEEVKIEEVLVDEGGVGGKRKGELVASFVPSVAGGGGVVCVLVDGRPIEGFPCCMNVKRRPPQLDIQKTLVKGVGVVAKVREGGVGEEGRAVVGGKHGISVFPFLPPGYTIEDVDIDRVGVRVWEKDEGGKRGKEMIVKREKELGGVVGSFDVGRVGEYEVEVTVDGVVVEGVGGVWAVEAVDLGMVTVEGLTGEKKYVGKVDEFKIRLRNAERRGVRGGKGRVEAVFVNAKGVREVVTLEDGGEEGEVVGRWVPMVEGGCMVSVYVDGEQILGPCMVDVCGSSSAPVAVSGESIAYGPGLGDIVKGEGTHFFVQLNDANGNKTPSPSSTLNVTLTHPDGKTSQLKTKYMENGGVFRCDYTTAQVGPYVVDVDVDGFGVQNNPFSVYSGSDNKAPESGGLGGAGNRRTTLIGSTGLVVEGEGEGVKVKRGYLNKQGGVRKNWKKRYFEVVDGSLTYFEEKGGHSLGSIPINGISKVYEVNNLKNHKYSFAIEQTGESRVFYMEATSSDERKGWLEMLNNLTKKKEEEKEEKPEGWDKGGEMEEREGNFDMTGLDPKLDDFFKQLWFEIIYPKSSLVVNEVFRIRINVTSLKTKKPVPDHQGRLDLLINLPNGQSAEIEPHKGSTPGTWVAIFTPTLEGRHACNVRFLGKYIQHRTAVLHVHAKKRGRFF